jgi:hypothetical protein
VTLLSLGDVVAAVEAELARRDAFEHAQAERQALERRARRRGGVVLYAGDQAVSLAFNPFSDESRAIAEELRER